MLNNKYNNILLMQQHTIAYYIVAYCIAYRVIAYYIAYCIILYNIIVKLFIKKRRQITVFFFIFIL